MKKQNGIALLPVAIIITVIAAVSLLLSYESSMNTNAAAAKNEAIQADLVAEAGMAHAKWQLAQTTDCEGYANLASTPFDSHSYSTNISPDNGSPVTISASGISDAGINRTLTDTNAKVYQTPYIKEYVLDGSGKDTFIEGQNGHLDHNKGDDKNLRINSETDKQDRSLLQFDISDIPTSTKVIEATLELYLDQSKGNNDEIFIHRITDDWVEDEVTWQVKRSGLFQNWNPQGGEYVANVSGSFIADVEGWKSADITQLVQDWVKVPNINQGMMLLSAPASGNNEKKFISSDDNNPTRHPKLTITYACECGQVCLNPETSKLLFVVSDLSNLNANDTERKDLIESWGYTVTLIEDSDSQGKFDDAITQNNVIYISETVSSGNVSDKVRNAAIGVVNEERAIVDDIGLASNFISDNTTSINILDASHYITSGFSLGTLTLSTSTEEFASLNGSITNGLRILADSSVGKPSLSAIEVGEALYDSGTAEGRRVQLPWSGNGFDFSALTDDAKTIMRRSIEWAASAGDEEETSNLIAYWKFDESSGLLAKESINGFDGTLDNGPEWETSGRVNGALNFNNTNSQVIVPHADALSPTKAITMSAWIYNDAAALIDSYRIISKESLGSNDNYFLSLGSNQLFMGIGDEFFTPDIDFETDIWYHVAGTFDDDADEVRIYIDGVEALLESTNAQMSGNTDNLYIGSNWEEYKWWEGLLDEVRLYDRALTVVEIEDIYNSTPVESGGEGDGSKLLPPDPPLESCSGNFLDEFNTDESYSGNDGTLKWSTDWLELNENDGPDSGDERVTDDDDNEYVLQLRDNDGGGEGVQREIALSAYKEAAFTFNYRRDGFDNNNDYVTVEISNNGGSSWDELESIGGKGTDNSYEFKSYNISSYISDKTRIRFLTSSKLGSSDEFYIDNVEITVNGCAD